MKNTNAANKRIARNSIFMSIRMVIVLCITFYTTRIVLSVLGVEDYGVYNVVCGFVSMFGFLSTSMSNGIQRFFNYELGRNGEEGANKVYNTAILIQILIVVVLFVLIEGIGMWYLDNKVVIPNDRINAAKWIFQFAIIGFSFSVIQAPFSAAIMAHEKMDFYALVSILDAILKLGIVFVVPFIIGDNLIIYGFLFALINILNFCLYLLYARINFSEIRLKRKFHKDMFLAMLGFSGWNFLGSFAGVMKEHGMNLVLNLFFGPVVNAARGVAQQINGGLQAFVQNISIPIRPQVIQSYAKEEYDRCLKLTFSLSKLSCCFIYFISFPIMLDINYILHLWLGNNIPEHTNTFVVIVVLITYINNLNAPVSAIVHASGQMKVYQTTTSVISLLCIPSAYLLLGLGCAPEFALLMILLFCTISQFAALRILQGIVSFELAVYLHQVLKPFIFLVICTCVFPVIPLHIMEESFLRFVIILVISFLSIGLGIYYMALDKSERNLIYVLIKKRK